MANEERTITITSGHYGQPPLLLTPSENTEGKATRIDSAFERRTVDGQEEFLCTNPRKVDGAWSHGSHWSRAYLDDIRTWLRFNDEWQVRALFCTGCGVIVGSYFERR